MSESVSQPSGSSSRSSGLVRRPFRNGCHRAAVLAVIASGCVQDTPQVDRVTLGKDVSSVVDSCGMSGSRVKVNLTKEAGDFGKIGLAVVNSAPRLTEIYMENQDGNGKRIGSLTLGLDADGSAFIGSSGPLRVIDTDSPYLHQTLQILKP